MKLNLSLRVILIGLFSTIIISSCTKADFIEANDPCSTEFKGEVITCGATRTAVYTFISANDEKNIEIQGDLTQFIGQDAVVTVTGATLTVTQSTVAVSTTRTIKLEGSVEACQEVAITITWTSNNSDDTISGDWSVKNADGTELAPPVAALQCDPRK